MHAPRVEAIPASTLALLARYGITPGRVGAGEVHGDRWGAWAAEAPVALPGRPTVHIERTLLEGAFVDLVRTEPRITVCDVPVARGVGATDLGAARVLDATGRQAVTSGLRTGPRRPWVGRLFWAPRRATTVPGTFSIAATPNGYAYRLASTVGVTLGLVGRGSAIAKGASVIDRYLSCHAPWLLGGMPPLSDMMPVAGGGATVQWGAAAPGTILIGAAALARDALSSQGLAAGLSEALASASIASGYDEILLSHRQEEQRRAHLAHLLQICRSHRFVNEPIWAEYIAFLEREARAPSLSSAAFVDEGLIGLIRRKGRPQSAATARPAS
ncbi:hypothetical protein MicloDRAFT_00001440 [Microvirga lotononidis]|uniref:Uncharacterized protein n=2 Tax=Microvirga lotononidis TaxID=864069 RepID=I4Z4L2_9HYPH|nr:hypothetical protein MicloDRAFT_00001440 [Microvirga lotononidis]